MYGYGDTGEQKHALDAGDAAGIVWIYGARSPMSGTMKVNNDAQYTTSRTVTLNSSVARATQMRFSNDNATWSGWEAYSATKGGWSLSAGDGSKTVYAQYRDAVGNVYAQSDGITLDTAAPGTTTNADTAGWHAASYSFSLTPADATSGVAVTHWRRLNRATVHSGTTVTLDGSEGKVVAGDQTIVYWSVDNAGNVEARKYVTVLIDSTPPRTRDDSDGLSHPGSFTLHLAAGDNHSGVAHTYYKVDGAGTWTEGSSVVVSGAGTHFVWYYSTDAVGNMEPVRVTWVVIAPGG